MYSYRAIFYNSPAKRNLFICDEEMFEDRRNILHPKRSFVVLDRVMSFEKTLEISHYNALNWKQQAFSCGLSSYWWSHCGNYELIIYWGETTKQDWKVDRPLEPLHWMKTKKKKKRETKKSKLSRAFSISELANQILYSLYFELCQSFFITPSLFY